MGRTHWKFWDDLDRKGFDVNRYAFGLVSFTPLINDAAISYQATESTQEERISIRKSLCRCQRNHIHIQHGEG